MPGNAATPAYPALPISAEEVPDDLEALRRQSLMEHHRLGHPYQKRRAFLDVDGQMKPNVPKLTCPTYIAFKARQGNRPPPRTKEERSTIPREDIPSDLSGKNTRRHPQRHTRHGQQMDFQKQTRRDRSFQASHRSRFVDKGFTQTKHVVCLLATQKPVRHGTQPTLVPTLVHPLHVIRTTETRHRRVCTHQVREQQEIKEPAAQDKSERSRQTPRAPTRARSRLSRLSSRQRYSHSGHISPR